jgi:hypothetical protein
MSADFYATASPRFEPMEGFGDEEQEAKPAGTYVDVAALFADGLPEPPAQSICLRRDGVGLFYAGHVNMVFGDPESAKSWLAYCTVVEALDAGGSGVIIDADHNGAAAILSRPLMLGAKPGDLSDPTRFRLYEREDRADLAAAVAECVYWGPKVAVVDSLGEVLPMFGAKSNDPDDYTSAAAYHTKVVVPIVDGIARLEPWEDAQEKRRTGQDEAAQRHAEHARPWPPAAS